MASVQPIMVSEAKAAKLLDLSARDFARLTAEGALPKGREIAPGLVRWDVEGLRRIARGEAIDGMSDVDWSA